jgi:dTDP-4-amino-4,6-dideoxygalactose transaminase
VVRKDFLVFGRPDVGQPEIDEVVDSLRSGWIGTGPKVERFERMLEDYVGVTHARCVSSCTAALFLMMSNLQIGPGDEVLVPSMTFVACANAVEHTGAKPVFVDSEPVTGLIDLAAAEEAITTRTKGIMPVHLAGRPVDLDRINRLRDQRKLTVLEDAAHAIGAEWHGRRIGNFGNPTAFSFYATKNITTIEGGAVVTVDPELAAEVEQAALHGLSAGAWRRYSDGGFKHYEATSLGYKFNMTDVQAALGIHQLPHLDEWIDRRADRWAQYDAALADLPLDLPPAPDSDTRHARHLYQVRITDDAPISRDDLLDALHAHRIGAGVHYRAIHLHPFYRDRYGIDPASLPIATDISERTVSLPLSHTLSEADLENVVDALRRALGG